MIAFMTDWGYKSYYVGVAKGVIKTINPNATIVDLTHGIEPFNVRMAMHMLARSVNDFPRETVFLVVIDQGVGTERKAIAFKSKNGYFFVGPDNGVFTLCYTEFGIEEMVELKNTKYFYKKSPTFTFHGRDIFAPVAAYIDTGIKLSDIGSRLKEPVFLPINEASFNGKTVRGEIAFYDGFGNLETNVHFDLFKNLNKNLGDEIHVKVEEKIFKVRYVKAFGEVDPGELLIHQDCSGYMEIAVNLGSAKERIKADQGVRLEIW